jgi:hypothetical protein
MLELPLGRSLTLLLVSTAFFSGIGNHHDRPGRDLRDQRAVLADAASLEPGGRDRPRHVRGHGTGRQRGLPPLRGDERGGSRAIAIVLSASSVVGAYVNAFVPRSVFGVLLGGVAMAVGGIICYWSRAIVWLSRSSI